MISIERLERIASEHAFQPATTERVIRLTDVLQRLAKDPGGVVSVNEVEIRGGVGAAIGQAA